MIIKRYFDKSDPNKGHEEFLLPGIPRIYGLDRIETKVWINAFIYGGTAFAAGLPFYKSAGIFLIVLVVTHLNFGRRLFFKGAVVLVFVTLAVWSGLIDEPSMWAADIRGFIGGLKDQLR